MSRFNYKGENIDKNYFEGWYIRLVDEPNNLIYAIIFGISLNEKDPHSFIQIINQENSSAEYLRFNINDFSYENKLIKIKENSFSPYSIKLKTKYLDINVTSSNFKFLDKSWGSYSVMGFLKYLPLPTNHEIIYLSAETKGRIIDGKNESNFNGISYMEKDWGNKFPKKWLWAQTNNFKKGKTNFLMIVANPFIIDLKVFICIIKINDKEYRFATYNRSKLKIIKLEKDIIILKFRKGNLQLNLRIDYKDEEPLIAPINNGKMQKVIGESQNSSMTVSLYKNATLLFKDESSLVACENLYSDN